MKTKPPFDGEIHAVSAKNMPDLNSPKREPGWFLGGPTPDPTPTRDEAVPTGWKLVPIEPTPKMLQDAAFNLSDEFGADFVKPLGDFARSLWAELLASAPAPASGGVDAVAVKALEWSEAGNRHVYKASWYTTWCAPSVFGDYVIRYVEHCTEPTRGYPVLKPFEPYFSTDTYDKHATLDEAKAAVWQKHEQRIRSALSPAATPVSEAEPAGITTHQVWLERVADRALQLGRRPTRAEILMCASDWAALAKTASSPAGPGHTDLMVTPESLDAFLSDNSPPDMLASSGPSSPAGGGVREALAALLDHVDRETCTHEETHRGGFIWTICDQCGRKWADDQGGFVPHSDPPAVARARLICEGLASQSTSAGRVGE